ncbi:MAG: MFS transporter [Anaerolineales bacterium]|nr:MFS transporter [Anaerolineales bacterium]
MVARYLTTLSQISRDARLFLLTSALFGFAIFGGIYTTLFNLYLLRLGYQADFAGVVNGAGQMVLGLSAIPIGFLGRYLGSKRLLAAGLAAIALGFGLIPLAEFSPFPPAVWIIVTHMIGQLGIGLYFVNAGPFLMRVTTPRERNYVYAINTALWPLAGFAGSLVGGFLPGVFAGRLGLELNQAAPYRYPLFLAAILMIPAVAALRQIRTGGQVELDPPPSGREMNRAPILIIVVLGLAVLLRVGGEGVVRTFFNIYLDTDLQLTTAHIGMLLAFGQLLSVPAALMMPLLAQRWGDGLTYLYCTWGMVPSLLLIAAVPHWAVAGLGFMGLMSLISTARPAIVVFQMEVIPPRWRTLMAGATTTAVGLGWGLASWGGGYLITRLGFDSLFIGGAILSAASAVVFWAYFRPRTPPVPQSIEPNPGFDSGGKNYQVRS